MNQVMGALALLAALSLEAGAANPPAALTSAPVASLPRGHDEALARVLANRPSYYPEQTRPTFKATAAWRWRPADGEPLWVSLACAPDGRCVLAVYRVDGSDISVLFRSPPEWFPLSDKAIVSTDAATKDLMVVDSMIRGKRAAFVRVGKGIVMDVSADPSRGRSEQGAAPSSKPTLEAAVPVVVAVLDAWREKQADVLATRTAFPFSASLALRDRKRLCEPRQRRIEARNANELGQRTSALFGHPFRREPVLGRALDPRYGAWRSYEPTNAPPGPIAYVQVELFDLPRDVDAFITMEVLPNGTVRRLSFEDFAWATRPNGSATPTEVERSVASPRVSASC